MATEERFILFSPFDFSLLFVRGLPSDPLADDPDAHRRDPDWRQKAIRGDVVQRIVMSPEHAKAMARQLSENVEAYEKEFGEVPSIKGSEPKEKPVRKRAARAK